MIKLARPLLVLFVFVPSMVLAEDMFTIQQKIVERTSQPIKFNVLHKSNFVGAAEHGEYKTVEEYLNLGMNPDAKDYNNHTALMGATLNGHNRIIKLLLSKGATVELKNKYGLDSIDYAKIQERKEMIPFLESHRTIIIRGLSSVGK
ncbi:ankyrin repeat domain-containing protein [bacterium]|nr:ankyrin repeat domain-containing protein [bacterium]